MCDVLDSDNEECGQGHEEIPSSLIDFQRQMSQLQLKICSLCSWECVLCALLGNSCHPPHQRCPAVGNMCVKCLRSGHGFSQCPNARWQPPQGFCSSCWLPTDQHFGLHNTMWGRQCTNAFADVAKFFVTLAFRSHQHSARNAQRLFSVARIIPSSILESQNDKVFYGNWLWQETRHVPHIVHLIERGLELMQ